MHIQHDQPLDLELTGFSAHDCATVFKSFLAELPEPLLTDAHYPAHLQIAPLSQALIGGQVAATAERQQHLLNSVQLLLLLLPEEHREQMPPEALHYTAKKMSSIVSYMIQQGLEIFEVPGKLATDIRAYFLERKRKNTMSPEQTLE
ncbi:rho GTPase-activating protein 19-like [Drosophila miranda]|uniref:rho GTPase-activating protein 19-like n=1 Tax=Drosophila miranda TaxID=7229 RepID=UPI00143F41CC|nr:rho GTPase-activating protein 19-like [Drosophila miranda]